MRNCKCGNQVADNAKACPKCGHRFTGAFTKFVAWVCAAFLGLMVLVGIIASHSDTPSVSSTSSAASPATPVSTTAPAPKPKPKTPAEMIALRKGYAKILDQQLLTQGIESETYTMGPQSKTLVIKDTLAGRVRQNAIQQNSDLFENMQMLGFKKLLYTNGFEDDLNFGVSWNIK